MIWFSAAFELELRGGPEYIGAFRIYEKIDTYAR